MILNKGVYYFTPDNRFLINKGHLLIYYLLLKITHNTCAKLIKSRQMTLIQIVTDKNSSYCVPKVDST